MWAVEVMTETGSWIPWAWHDGNEGWIAGGQRLKFRKQLAVQKAQRVMNIVDWAYGVRLVQVEGDD